MAQERIQKTARPRRREDTTPLPLPRRTGPGGGDPSELLGRIDRVLGERSGR